MNAKVFLLGFLLFAITFSFGQDKTWGQWKSVPCFNGLSFRVDKGSYNAEKNTTFFYIQYRNSYNEKVSFSVTVSNESNGRGDSYSSTGRTSLNANSTSDGLMWHSIVGKTNTLHVENVSKVCFHHPNGFEQCTDNYNGYGDYASFAECGGNYTIFKKNQNTNNSNTQNSNIYSNNSTNNNNSSQNNKTNQQTVNTYMDFYRQAMSAHESGNYDQAITLWNKAYEVAVNNDQRNQAKQWAEQTYQAKQSSNQLKQQQENQRIAQENARHAEEERQKKIQQQQQYNNTYNQATNSLSSGDYQGAIQGYTNALNAATSKTEKNIATTGAVLSSVGGVFDAFAKAKEEKKEKERIENERKQLEIQQANNIMEANWKNANSLAEHEDYNQAIKIMTPYLNANKINASSISTIGYWYSKLNNFDNAKNCYEKAMKLTHKCCAVHLMGDLYQYGQGVEVNYETALYFYKLSCENADKTGCENYEKLKPIADEATKIETDRKNKAKTTITNFNFKPYVDYLVFQLEKQGFMFSNIGSFCQKDLSKSIELKFEKDSHFLITQLNVEYIKEIKYKLTFYYHDDLLGDISKLQLPALISNKKINEDLEFSKIAPKAIPLSSFKNNKYKGFEKATEIKNDETIEAYEHNLGISCNDNNEQIKWLEKIIAKEGNNNYYYMTRLEHIYRVSGKEKKALHLFRDYISKTTNQEELNSRTTNSIKMLKEKLDIYEFEKLIILADAGVVYASDIVADCYRNGEIRRESTSTSNENSKSVTVSYLNVEKNWTKALLYYTDVFESDYNKAVACVISELFKKGGYGLDKNNKLSKEWKKKAKDAGYKCN